MGGVFFASNTTSKPIQCLWRHRFPQKVSRNMVTFQNSNSIIMNSDLELCGNIACHVVVADTSDVVKRTIWTGLDNTVNVWWTHKGSATATKAPACLL